MMSPQQRLKEIEEYQKSLSLKTVPAMIAKTIADVKLLFPEIDTDHLADAILSREGELAPGFPIADAASPQKHRTKVPDYAFPLSAIG